MYVLVQCVVLGKMTTAEKCDRGRPSPPSLSTGHNWSLFAERRDHFKLVRCAVGAIGDRHCQHQRVRDFFSLARHELEAEFAHKHGGQEFRLEHGHVHTETLPWACLEHLA